MNIKFLSIFAIAIFANSFAWGRVDSLRIDTILVNQVFYTSYLQNFEAQIYSDSLDTFSYTWWFGNDSSANGTEKDTLFAVSHKYQAAGTYTLSFKVTSSDGNKSDSASIQVVVEDLCNQPAVNVFTPNNDGINDQFIPVMNGLNFFKFVVYSRWGNVVYKMDTPQQQIVWDGRTPDGTLVSQGVYFYVITPVEGYSAPDKETVKGFVYIFY